MILPSQPMLDIFNARFETAEAFVSGRRGLETYGLLITRSITFTSTA